MRRTLSAMLVALLTMPAIAQEITHTVTGTIGDWDVNLVVTTENGEDPPPPPPPPVDGIVVYPGDNLHEKIVLADPRPEIINFAPGTYDLDTIIKLNQTKTLRALDPDAEKPVIRWVGGDSIAMFQPVSNSEVTFENLCIDGQDGPTRAIRCLYAASVTIRDCEIRNCAKHMVDVTSGASLLVENSYLHHALRVDAAGAPIDAHCLVWVRTTDVVVRGCTFDWNTGDNIQQERGGGGDTVLVEDCVFRNSPLDRTVHGLQEGTQVGENGIDTKRGNTAADHTNWVIRRCRFLDWRQTHRPIPAALNLKERVTGTIEDCTFDRCYVAFRMRGSQRGLVMGPWTISGCMVDSTDIGIRMEDSATGIEFVDNEFRSTTHYTQVGSPFVPDSITFRTNGFSVALPTFPANVVAEDNYVLAP